MFFGQFSSMQPLKSRVFSYYIAESVIDNLFYIVIAKKTQKGFVTNTGRVFELLDQPTKHGAIAKIKKGKTIYLYSVDRLIELYADKKNPKFSSRIIRKMINMLETKDAA